MQTKPTYLHPKEEPFGPCLELEHVDPPAGALRHALELTVVGEDDQILQRAADEQSQLHENSTAEPQNLQENRLAPVPKCVRVRGEDMGHRRQQVAKPVTSRVSAGQTNEDLRHRTKVMRARRGARC